MFFTLLALSLVAVDPPQPVRVMSYNISYANPGDGKNAWEKRKDFLAETVRAYGPDLLGTQETLPRQRDDLKERLDGYEVLAVGREDGRERGEMTAVFYRRARFEKLDGGHFWLSETPEVAGSRSWDSSLPRMATWLKLKDLSEPEGRPIAFFNTHFDHRGPKARLESARLLRRKIGELGAGCRIIVTGDFNVGEGSAPYQTIFPDPSLRDTLRAAHPARAEQEGTFTNFRAGKLAGDRIDWIGCSADWDVLEAAIGDAGRDGRSPSDHHPVTALLRGKK